MSKQKTQTAVRQGARFELAKTAINKNLRIESFADEQHMCCETRKLSHKKGV